MSPYSTGNELAGLCHHSPAPRRVAPKSEFVEVSASKFTDHLIVLIPTRTQKEKDRGCQGALEGLAESSAERPAPLQATNEMTQATGGVKRTDRLIARGDSTSEFEAVTDVRLTFGREFEVLET